MSGFVDFAQVLERKIRREIESEAPVIAPTSQLQSLEYRHLAWLLGQTPRQEFRPQAQKTAYKITPKPRPPHKLDAIQQTALAELGLYASLPHNFSKAELKQAFRQGALQTHPDRGGKPSQFQAVKQAYNELLRLFNVKV